nr:hypothetical protein [Tanacetum cinerariifolium]
MADQRTMAQLLQAPTEGYENAIVVPAITTDNFELKHGLLTLVQNKQFFRHDKEDPHAHHFDESFSEAWDRFKDLVQACPHHDEALNSKNQGNFIKLLKLLASYNVRVANVVLKNATYNAKYTSMLIQKEIVSIIADYVRKHIWREVGDSYYCVMVDEARDDSKEEQMAIGLRFFDKDRFIKESKIYGQGYDGASNIRWEWNSLQALVAKDYPYAYYVHCFVHKLQLALVAASREVIPVQQFFTKFTSVFNVICAFSKLHDELQNAKSIEIEHLLELGEIKTGKGANQSGTLRRVGETRWGSHFNSACSLFWMFSPTRLVLESIYEDGFCASQCGEADVAYTYLKSFEFILILHLMKEVMGRTGILI